ncbi:MAG TPA: methyltransferase [bacterium]|nr:methyltransferase [bacterium]
MTDPLISFDRMYDRDTVIAQRRGGYRFSVDALLLSWFAHEYAPARVTRTLELGAGSGIVSILLKRRGLGGTVDAIERQESLFSLLAHNVSLNHLEASVFPILKDIRMLSAFHERYDLVCFNPPYRAADSGRTAPDEERAAARHELFGSLDDFLRIGGAALKKKGRLFFVYPVARLAFACLSTAAHGLYPRQIVLVSESPADPPSLALFCCAPGDVRRSKLDLSLVTMREKDGAESAVASKILHASSC